MRMLEIFRSKKDAIATMGDEERAEARRLGISSFYSDPAYPGFITEERPDGSKVRIPIDKGISEGHVAAE